MCDDHESTGGLGSLRLHSKAVLNVEIKINLSRSFDV